MTATIWLSLLALWVGGCGSRESATFDDRLAQQPAVIAIPAVDPAVRSPATQPPAAASQVVDPTTALRAAESGPPPAPKRDKAATARLPDRSQPPLPTGAALERPAAKAALGSAAPPTAAPCGEKGQAACPLQGFMERDLQGPLDAGDLATVARALAQVAKFVPVEEWNGGASGWSAIAEAGATAARRADVAATQRSCKACHKAWRKPYRAEYRALSIAAAPRRAGIER
jgi:hypothetical protein